jgi:hypothetical protein
MRKFAMAYPAIAAAAFSTAGFIEPPNTRVKQARNLSGIDAAPAPPSAVADARARCAASGSTIRV